MHNPVEQFTLKSIIDLHLFGYDISLTNSSIWMLGIAVFLSIIMLITSNNLKVIPNSLQIIVETKCDFVKNILRNIAGDKAMEFYPLVLSYFIFILFSNIVGLLPYSFTVTTHITITFAMALFFFIVITGYGINKHGLHFFSLFIPKGTPTLLQPLMFILELVLYLFKPFTLAVRLAANMTAGHILMKIFASFATFSSVGIKISSIVAITGLFFMELLISGVQAYLFVILICNYCNDAVNLH